MVHGLLSGSDELHKRSQIGISRRSPLTWRAWQRPQLLSHPSPCRLTCISLLDPLKSNCFLEANTLKLKPKSNAIEFQIGDSRSCHVEDTLLNTSSFFSKTPLKQVKPKSPRWTAVVVSAFHMLLGKFVV